MIMKYLLTGYLIGAVFMGVRAQEAYQILHFSSPHNCFPDTARDHGHLDGDGNYLPREGHYDDSSVLLVVPTGLRMRKTVDLVVWFHGWHNSIDTALQFYGLARQFAASRRNAVLVLPEAVQDGLKLESNFETAALPTLTQAGPLGATYAAFNPSGAGELKADMQLSLPAERLADRRGLLSELDRLRRRVDATGSIESLSFYLAQGGDNGA